MAMSSPASAFIGWIADVGLAGQHHVHAFAAARLAGGLTFCSWPRRRSLPAALVFEGVIFLGEIQRRLHQHAQRDQLVDQGVDLAGEGALQRFQRAAGSALLAASIGRRRSPPACQV
jgi:hypothetical protein